MVAVWNQEVNPWGETGGNPMVKMNWRGRDAWSYYRYPKTYPEVNPTGTPILPNAKYQNAWDTMYDYYVNIKGLPTFEQEDYGFTYNQTNTGLAFEAMAPERPLAPGAIPLGGP